MKNKIMLFAGTTEGRQLCEFLKQEKKEAVVYVATDYGEDILNSLDLGFLVLKGRMKEIEMTQAMEKEKPWIVIDCTHPYAVIVSENIKIACSKNNIPYIRIVRQSLKKDNIMRMNTMEDMISYLNFHKGNILVTTGTKEIQYYTQIKSYEKRVFARILPDAKALHHCNLLGIKGKHLICMQGPFSKQFNYVLLKELNIDYLITKESGKQGGFLEKIEAAKEAEVEVLVLNRPRKENGYLLEEVKKMIQEGVVP